MSRLLKFTEWIVVVSICLTTVMVSSLAEASGQPAQVAVAKNANGDLVVYYIRNGTLMRRVQQHQTSTNPWGVTTEPWGGSWSTAEAVSTRTVVAVSLALSSDGLLVAAFIDDEGRIYYTNEESAGGNWRDPIYNAVFLNVIATDVKLTTNANGKIEVLYLNSSNELWRVTLTGFASYPPVPPYPLWSSPSKLANNVEEFATLQNSFGKITVFFTKWNNIVWQTEQTAQNSSTWTSPAQFLPVASSTIEARRLALGRNEVSGRLELFYIDSSLSNNHVLSHCWEHSPGGAWGCGSYATTARNVWVGTNADHRMDMFYADYPDRILNGYHQWAADSAWNSSGQQGFSVKSLATSLDNNGNLHFFYQDTSGEFFHNWQLEPGLHWAGEYPFFDEDNELFSVGSFTNILQPACTDWHVNDHTLISSDGVWNMFGIVAGPDRPNCFPTYRFHLYGSSADPLGHASSTTLLSTTGWDYDVRAFRELWNGLQDNSTSVVAWAPHVIEEDGTYYMFYCAGGGTGAPTIPEEGYRIALRTATSINDQSDPWTGIFQGNSDDPNNSHHRWSEPTYLFRDGFQGRDPMVMRLVDEYNTPFWVMYYAATSDVTGGYYVVKYRTSYSLTDWSTSTAETAYTDHHSGMGFGPTESPFVVAHGPWYYLFIGPRPYDHPTCPSGVPASGTLCNWEHPGYVGTDVFRSSDWRDFSNAQWVGHIPAHAAELVQDGQDWYISSAGIDQNGLWLAPFTWNDGY